MEQTISTSTTSTTPTGAAAAPAPQAAAAVIAAAVPNGTATPDAAAQFGSLLDALQATAALAPVTDAGDDKHAGTSAKDGKAGDQAQDRTTADAAATAVAAGLV